jgi:hypothetical protein
LFEIIPKLSRRFRRKIELDHIVGTGKKVNIKKRVQRFRGSKVQRFRGSKVQRFKG